MFDACASCNGDYCESCVDSSWTLTTNGCFDPEHSLTQLSQSTAPENSNTLAIIVGVVIGILVIVAIVCAIVYSVTNKNKSNSNNNLFDDADTTFAEMDAL